MSAADLRVATRLWPGAERALRSAGAAAAMGAAVGGSIVHPTGVDFVADLPSRPVQWQRGLTGWIVVVGMTAWGVFELIDDIRQLR